MLVLNIHNLNLLLFIKIYLIELKNGNIELNHYPYSSSGNKKTLFTTNNDFSKYYYPGLFLVQTNVNTGGTDKTKASITNVQFMRNQFYGVNKESEILDEEIDFIGVPPPIQSVYLTEFNFIEFKAQNLANLLGFSNLNSGFSTTTSVYVYRADKLFRLSYIPDSIIVEYLILI